MTKKNYIAIAAIVERNKLGKTKLVDDLAMMFLEDNSNFNPERFKEACGSGRYRFVAKMGGS